MVYSNLTDVEGDCGHDQFGVDLDKVTIESTYKLKIKSDDPTECEEYICRAYPYYVTVKELLNGYLPIINITSIADYPLSDINIGIFFVAADGTNNIICEWKGAETFNPGETKTYSTSIKYKQPKAFICGGGIDLEEIGSCSFCLGLYTFTNYGIKTCSLNEKLSSNGEYWIEVTANNFLIYKQKVKFTESGLVFI